MNSDDNARNSEASTHGCSDSREVVSHSLEQFKESPAKMESIFAGDPQMQYLIDAFLKSIPAHIEQLRKLDPTVDLVSIAILSRQIFGSASGCGFPLVAIKAKELEREACRLRSIEMIQVFTARLIELLNDASHQNNQSAT